MSALGTATRRALIGAVSAIVAGSALGIAARSANEAMQRGAPPSALAIYWRTLSRPHGAERLWAEALAALPRLAPYAVVLLLAIAVVAVARGLTLWLRARPRAARATVPNAAPVITLAATGASRAVIARRTGMSQDAVALAMYLGG